MSSTRRRPSWSVRIFQLLLERESCRKVAEVLNAEGLVTKQYVTKTGKTMGGKLWTSRRVYEVVYRSQVPRARSFTRDGLRKENIRPS